MTVGLYSRLSLMMFLEWFIMGAWYVTVGNYMAKIGMGSAIYWAYTVVPLSALVSPYFIGLVADRYFATQKLLGALHLVGGIAMFAAPWAAESGAGSATGFLGLLLLHALCFAPTIALTSALAFHHLTRADQQFPLIRVFGTIGWIAAGVLVSRVLQADETGLPLRVAGLAGIGLGAYSLTLPHTPPAQAGAAVSWRHILDLPALAGLMSRPFLVFLACVFVVFIPTAAYYSYAPVFVNDLEIPNPGFKMSFGQMSEIFFMLLIPVLLARLGMKVMLAAGMAAWFVRYGLFAGAATNGSVGLVIAAIILHGICFDFLYVVAQIYVDKKATPTTRAQAQGLFVLVTTGLGQLAGAQATGWLFNALVEAGAHSAAAWQTYWTIPAVLAGVVTLAFVFGFHDPAATVRRPK
ncbi:MAG: MFS transporter [Verrucomicrobia bacterium]|nr:MFS transporter [Verrucomicrobiota bacterium]